MRVDQPDTHIQTIREFYQSYPHPSSYGYDLLQIPDSILGWLTGLFRHEPIPVPDIPDTEWNRFYSLIQSHWIESTLAYLLHDAPAITQPPGWVCDQLTSRFRSADQQNLQAEAQIRRLVKTAETSRCPILIIKGPALSHQVYPHPAMRTGSDIDLIVPDSRVGALSGALKQEGYRVRFDTFATSPRLYHHLQLYPGEGKKNDLMVEVHWRPLFLPGSGGNASAEDLLAGSVQINTGIAPFRTLNLADALIYAACHMCIFHASMLRLSWIADIHYLANAITTAGTWDEVQKRAAHWQGRLALEQAFRHAYAWFGTTLPDPYSDWDTWLGPGEDEIKTFAHLKSRQSGEEIHLHEVVAGLPTIREKLLALWFFISRTDQIRMEYPDTAWRQYPSVWWEIICKELKK